MLIAESLTNSLHVLCFNIALSFLITYILHHSPSSAGMFSFGYTLNSLTLCGQFLWWTSFGRVTVGEAARGALNWCWPPSIWNYSSLLLKEVVVIFMSIHKQFLDKVFSFRSETHQSWAPVNIYVFVH